jgi:dTDP-L-rhamnose 4-epimerase
MRVLVTGAAGFIGSHVAEIMQAAGHEVRGLDSLTPAVHRGRPDHVPDDLVVGDVRDRAAVDEALAGMDAVCHQAALVGLGVDLSDLPGYADVNVTGTAVLLEAMGRHQIARLVFASSMVVYGEGAYDCATHGRVRPAPRYPADLAAGRFEPRCPRCGQPLTTATVTEDAPLDPRNAYAASKVAQEHLASSWARMTGGAAVGLRYHNVYGPRMPRDTPYSGVAAIFRSCLENGTTPRVFEDGGQRRDFVHVHDVARANLLALEAVDRASSASPAAAASSPATAASSPAAMASSPAGAASSPATAASSPATAANGQPAAPPGAAAPCPTAADAGGLRCYNVASGEPHTVGEMASTLAAAFGGGIDPVVTGEYRLGDVRHIVASPEAAARDLGFRAQIRFAKGMTEFAHAPLRDPAALSATAR